MKVVWIERLDSFCFVVDCRFVYGIELNEELFKYCFVVLLRDRVMDRFNVEFGVIFCDYCGL